MKVIVGIWCSFAIQFDILNHFVFNACEGTPIVQTFQTSPLFQQYAWNGDMIGEGWILAIISILWDIFIFRQICKYAVRANYRKYQRQLEKQTLD